MNVFMVNVSKFPFDKTLKKNEFKCIINDKEETVEGYYQLDPIPNMLKKAGVQIDKAILFATNKVRKVSDVDDQSGMSSGPISPLELFKEHLVTIHPELDQDNKIIDIDIEENIIADAISEFIRVVLENNTDDSIELYIDTHGGFRSTQLIQEAIMQLLFENNIHAHFYNVYYEGESENAIRRDEAVNIFDFVSGIREFDYTGRIDSIKKYLYVSGENNKEDDDFIKAIEDISVGIQWCNIVDFEKGIKNLKSYFAKKQTIKNPYLALFEDYIRRDYGKLVISRDIKVVDMVEWCYRKGLYQQALTIIESRMPDDIINRGLLIITEEGKDIIEQESIDNNTIINRCVSMSEPDIKKRFPFNETTLDDKKINTKLCQEFRNNNKAYSVDAMKKSFEKCLVKVDNVNIDLSNYIEINKRVVKDVCYLLFVHKSLKNIRNRSNHAASDKAFNTNNVKAAIQYYIDLYRRTVKKIN
ncbi:MAG: hypothetical protein K5644_08830 [Lachnospiraceae bacterium]|nr:hypothetical protein [Lachnospiraceae bacterium]